MINKLLNEELKCNVHALSIVVSIIIKIFQYVESLVEMNINVCHLFIKAKTPDQWKNENIITQSPPCRGGFGK